MGVRWSFKKSFGGTAVAVLALAGGAFAVGPQSAVASDSGGTTRQISSSGTTSIGGVPGGPDGLAFPEIRGTESDAGTVPSDVTITNRAASRPGRSGSSVASAGTTKSNAELTGGFDGLDHRQQRLANGGNQFSLEPPDQGLCVGNGRVLETVNDVLRVYDTSGNPLTGVIDLNTFYGYAAAINRTTGAQGPFVTDPSCIFDAATQRWFVTVLTLDVDADGAFTGTNHLDTAVSMSSDPTGSWTLYRVAVQDNGTAGTPDHHCAGGFCLGDYPHIGADASGFYITTNEYPFFADGFHGAQIYAFSKQALASGASTVAVTQLDTAGLDAGHPGFTVWPAVSSPDQFATSAGGTEYFLSSNAAEEADGSGSSNQLLVWGLTNTASLASTPSLRLSHVTLAVNPYAVPPRSAQKAGPVPLAECLNVPKCARLVLGAPDHLAPEVESPLDSNDTRMQQVTWANGKLWGALDTALTVDGHNQAGVAWFVVTPGVTAAGTVTAKLTLNGYLGLAGNNVTYPAIGVTSSGRGVMAFTVVGADHYPSAGYTTIDAIAGTAAVHIAREGVGPQDGFSGYKAFGNPPRPRWGDYGAAAVDGTTVWTASEYIAQSCTLAQYQAAPFGSCGGTRTALANWGTRISQLSVR
ncbi:hypothetical protein [Terrabacter sp. MAHUQ-38]|uniref:hypothetical protein n=1 Tax=unclassified Terrabacter TaxID=2630222 RepID=UPI00165E4724|nr:hypothetical protein [Terrabacter sp. MAHUQ-38]MBC9822152.1 hypothetical protein [Terrabacter sp. MAHUQ-38]